MKEIVLILLTVIMITSSMLLVNSQIPRSTEIEVFDYKYGYNIFTGYNIIIRTTNDKEYVIDLSYPVESNIKPNQKYLIVYYIRYFSQNEIISIKPIKEFKL